MVLATKNLNLAPPTAYPINIKTADPLRSILIANLSAANITIYLGETVGSATDVFTIPPSTSWEVNVWELSDEDYHDIIITSGPATGTVSIQYKASQTVPAMLAAKQAPRGQYAG
jgi:hypothetical protein